MKEEMKQFFLETWREHRARNTGVTAGVVFSIGTMLFSFWCMLFIVLCGAAGWYVGSCLDRGETVGDILDRILPSRFQRYR